MPDMQALKVALADARANLDDGEKFRAVLCSTMTALGLDDGDVAERMAVSRSTVKRWMNGMAIPLPVMRKPVYAFLARRISEAEQNR
jgi:transcriptional regulator with XRE-family HTH domain